MIARQIRKYSEIEKEIVEAIDLLADPVRQTLGPRGGNVIFQTDSGDIKVTNDGVTIAKSINLKDEFQDAIAQIIKQGSLKTNLQAGDGTSSTILWTSILSKAGLKLIGQGMNHRDVADAYDEFVKVMHKSLSKLKHDVKNDEDLFAIAKISANNDEEIAKNTVRVVRTAGEDGYIFMEPSNSKETEIKEDTGFVIDSGIFTHEISNNGGPVSYEDIPVLITDKQLYYSQEAETILRTCIENGYKEVVIVAKNFVGEALPFFIANHQQGNIKVLLVKDENISKTDGNSLEDLASYLDGEVISEAQGKIVDRLEIGHFCIAKKAYADGAQTVIMRDEGEDDKRLQKRIKSVKAELKKLGDSESEEKRTLKKRLASLTNGIVTLRIGGSTPIEVEERRFRYEDAISAGRAAVKDGYLLGGGTSILQAYHDSKFKCSSELEKVFNSVAEANMRQIAENSGENPDIIVRDSLELPRDEGFNALTLKMENLKDAGVFDPYKVTEMALENAVSIAKIIISSRYLILNERRYGESENKESRG